MEISEASRIANRLLIEMRPYCERIEIAGSVRRNKPDVKDLEIVACPRWEADNSGLFADEFAQRNRLLQWAFDYEAAGAVRWIKPGTHEIIPWAPKPDGKYWRGLLTTAPVRIKLDLFLCSLENFGLIYLIRTGAAEFSEAVVTHAKRIGKPCRDGFLHDREGNRIETPNEQDVFDVLNLEYVQPSERRGAVNLRAKRK